MKQAAANPTSPAMLTHNGKNRGSPRPPRIRSTQYDSGERSPTRRRQTDISARGPKTPLTKIRGIRTRLECIITSDGAAVRRAPGSNRHRPSDGKGQED